MTLADARDAIIKARQFQSTAAGDYWAEIYYAGAFPHMTLVMPEGAKRTVDAVIINETWTADDLLAAIADHLAG